MPPSPRIASYVAVAVVLVARVYAGVSHTAPTAVLTQQQDGAAACGEGVVLNDHARAVEHLEDILAEARVACYAPDKYYCAWTERGLGVPPTLYETWGMRHAGCVPGEHFCSTINVENALNEFAVKEQCEDEDSCIWNDGRTYEAYECHSEIIKSTSHLPVARYQHVCGKCVFHKPSLSNISDVSFPSAGSTPELRLGDFSGPVRALVEAAECESQAVQMEGMMRFSEAEALYESAVATRTRELGEFHPDTMASLENLVRFYDAAGFHGKSRRTVMRLKRAPFHAAERPPQLHASDEVIYSSPGDDARLRALEPATRREAPSEPVSGR